jgi:hypothetical protein
VRQKFLEREEGLVIGEIGRGLSTAESQCLTSLSAVLPS